MRGPLKRIQQWVKGEVPQPDERVPAPASAAVAGPPLRILMVCSGNICRSPTAEAVLRAKLQRAGLAAVQVDSAGTHGFHVSEPPDPRAQAAAKRRGYDLAKLRARPVRDEDFQQFDWLLAMDDSHLRWLQQRLPAAQGGVSSPVLAAAPQVRLLMDFAQRSKGTAEVPDPYYGSPQGFERVLDLVEDACDGVVLQLLARSGRPGEGRA